MLSVAKPNTYYYMRYDKRDNEKKIVFKVKKNIVPRICSRNVYVMHFQVYCYIKTREKKEKDPNQQTTIIIIRKTEKLQRMKAEEEEKKRQQSRLFIKVVKP